MADITMLGFREEFIKRSVRLHGESFRRWQHDGLQICVVAQEGTVFWQNNWQKYRGKIWEFFRLKDSKVPNIFIDGVGILAELDIIKRPQKAPRYWFTGSPAHPHKTWYFRIGRIVIKGDSPDKILKLVDEIKYRIALFGAKLAEDALLCEACGNGLVEHHEGFPGESFEVCRNCGKHHAYHFNRTEIE